MTSTRDESTFASTLARTVAARRDHPAFTTPEGSLTWMQLHRQSRCAAATLIDLGVSRGSRVGLIMANGLDWVVLATAVLRLGAVLVPLSTMQTRPELESQLAVAEVDLLVAGDRVRRRDLREELADLPGVVWGSELLAEVPTVSALHAVMTAEFDGRPDDDLVVLFTSGSSGAPKGVIHTHRNALASVRSGLRVRCVTADDRLYLPMPLFWTGGFATGYMTAIVSGATLVTESEPSPASTLDLLQREKVTLFRGWPQQAEHLAVHAAAADLSSLRPASLQALLPASTRAEAGARSQLLGMTETFGPYSGDPQDSDMPRVAWGSCGTPFDTIEVLVVDPDTGQRVPVAERGEVWVRGPQLMRGLVGRADEEVFTPDGWYRTGDLAHLGVDGRLWYVARLDDMVKVSGVSVYPIEVERALATLPGVGAAHVTAVPRADGAGLRLGAVVLATAPDLDEHDVREGLRPILSSFKIPAVLRVLPPGTDVARTPSGKVDLPALRTLLERTPAP